MYPPLYHSELGILTVSASLRRFGFKWLSSDPHKTSRFSSLNAPLSLIALKALILVTHWSLLSAYCRLPGRGNPGVANSNFNRIYDVTWKWGWDPSHKMTITRATMNHFYWHVRAEHTNLVLLSTSTSSEGRVNAIDEEEVPALNLSTANIIYFYIVLWGLFYLMCQISILPVVLNGCGTWFS
jgi:hypothetical protein